MKLNLLVGLIYLFPVFFFCRKSESEGPPFTNKPEVLELKPQAITEASGIADSYKHPGNCWVQEDSGNPPEIILVGHDGTIRKKVFLAGAINRDWEDISVAPVSGISHVFVPDFGDNFQLFYNYTIYRFPEPSIQTDTIKTMDQIRFVYPDKAHDAEAMMIDPLTGNIYIITKRDVKSKVYLIPSPQNTDTVIKATYLTDLTYNQVVSASMSADGTEILIKTLNSVYYYKRDVTSSMKSVLNGRFQRLAYIVEPQGEAIGFANNGSGFFTISEKPGIDPVKLYYYKRL